MNKIKIIAECGCNWTSLEEAKLMIQECKKYDLDLVKFQLFDERVIKESDHYKFLKTIQLSFEDAKELFEYGKSINQDVFFTPMYPEAVDMCEKIGVNYYKIRFDDRFELEMGSKIHETNKCTFISEMTSIYRLNRHNPHYLKVVPKYPARIWDYIQVIEPHFFKLYDGMSDHTPDLTFLQITLPEIKEKEFWWEKHVKIHEDCLESDWSVKISELGKVIQKYKKNQITLNDDFEDPTSIHHWDTTKRD